MSRLHNNDAMLGVKTCHAARTCCAGRALALSRCAGPGPAQRYGMQGLARWLHAWRWRTWQCLVWPPTRRGTLLWRHMHKVYSLTCRPGIKPGLLVSRIPVSKLWCNSHKELFDLPGRRLKGDVPHQDLGGGLFLQLLLLLRGHLLRSGGVNKVVAQCFLIYQFINIFKFYACLFNKGCSWQPESLPEVCPT